MLMAFSSTGVIVYFELLRIKDVGTTPKCDKPIPENLILRATINTHLSRRTLG